MRMYGLDPMQLSHKIGKPECSQLEVAVDFMLKFGQPMLQNQRRHYIMDSDWDTPTVLKKKRPSAKDAKSSAVLNQAMASGNVEVRKKCNPVHRVCIVSAATNKQDKADVNLSKVEASDELRGFKA